MRRSARLWLAGVIFLAALLAYELQHGARIETSILALLPATERDAVVEAALKVFTSAAAQKLVVLVGHREEARARVAAVTLADSLRESGAFLNVTDRVEARDEEAFFELCFPYRSQLLARATQDKLKQPGGGAAILRESLRALHTPLSGIYSGILERDPLLSFPEYVRNLPLPPGEFRARDGALVAEAADRVWVLVACETAGDAFGTETQKRVIEALEVAKSLLTRGSLDTAEVLASGVVRFAHTARHSMESEVSVIGFGSTVGVVLLLLLTFRSLRQLALLLLSLGVGFLTAFAATFFVFDDVHLITIVFGMTLVGIADDYSFHFFAEQLVAGESWHPVHGLKQILPALTLGLATSLLAYAGLFITPFPGLRQMALFASTGLIGSFLTVVCWYPALAGPGAARRAPVLLNLGRRLLAFWQRFAASKLRWLVLALFAPFLVIGLFKLEPNDDVRLLQSAPEPLRAEDARVRALTGRFDTSRCFVVEGNTSDEVLERQTTLLHRLESLRAEGALGAVAAIAQIVPPRSVQFANRALLQAAVIDRPGLLGQHMQELGFADEVVRAALDELAQPPAAALSVEEWLASSASAPLRFLWLGATARGVASIVLVGDVKDGRALAALDDSARGIHFFDQLEDIRELLARHRVRASVLVGAAYLLIFVVLALRYGIRRGSRVTVPPVLAGALALAVGAFTGQLYNLFSVLAILLVLGMGIDYSIFLAEARGPRAGTFFAIQLSAVTTVLTFGLLGLSSTPVLASFGVTVFAGLTAACLLAPLGISDPGERDTSDET